MRLILLVAALLLAGCADSTAPTASLAIEQKADDPGSALGSLAGLVVDETITPIVGAKVILRGVELETTTDENGEFLFQKLEPGVYFIDASAPDHEKVQASTNVKAGKIEQVRLALLYVAPAVPFVDTVTWNALHTLSTPAIVVYGGVFSQPTSEMFGTAIVEGTWSGTIIAPDPDAAVRTQTWIGPMNKIALTPMQVHQRIDTTELEEQPTEIRVKSYPGFDTVAVDAKSEMFLSIFYHHEAPEAWSFYDQ